MYRRSLLKSLTALPLLALAGRSRLAYAAGGAAPTEQELQKNWKELLADGADIAPSREPLKLTAEEWKKRLSPEAYHVLREEGTEHAGTSLLLEEHRPGVFVCAGCSLPLFTSAMKFDSGTGWPSFFTSIPGALGTGVDGKLGYERTEYHCIRCSGHHGHVFPDGPPPTGQRYCNNGVALRFIPKAQSKPPARSGSIPFGPKPIAKP